MRSVEAEGDSIDAAIEQALGALRTTRDRVEIEILSNASRGLFGLGGRKARVRATVRQPISERILASATGEASPPTSLAPEEKGAAHSPVRSVSEERQPPRQQAVAPSSLDEKTARRAAQVLSEIIGHIGITAQVAASVEGGTVLLQLTGDDSGLLIGRKGQMLDALEYVVSRIVSRGQSHSVRVAIDCERYRDRRRESLQQLARRMSGEAKRKKRVVKLNPMSARDRRIVHLALQQEPGITTRSSGKGEFRRLVIIPDGVSDPTAS